MPDIPVSFYRTTQSDISNVPIVDGQIVVGTSASTASMYIDNGNTRLEVGGGGGGGSSVALSPTPSATVSESTVVSTINSSSNTTEAAPSVYAMQQWSNAKTVRVVYTGSIPSGATGIGTWQSNISSPTAAQESGWGWWYNDAFKVPTGSDGYSCDLAFKFDPLAGGEPLALGGYILDTTTGYLCIKFAKATTRATHKIAVDITYTRNSIQSSSPSA